MARDELESGDNTGGAETPSDTIATREPLHQIQLERVLGVTVNSNAAVDCSPATNLVAYPAGCAVVLFNPRKNRQTHILNTSKKSITSLRFSTDGRYLVTGECGHQPAVRVWDVQEASLLQEFTLHKYGITCVGFSPGNKYVVSVGFQHDMIVNVWDWQRNVKVASNKVSCRVKAISFAENGSYFVTVGNRHVKFWYLELSRSSKLKEAVPLTGRSAILGEQRNNYFCDVACGRGEMGDSTYAITRSGLLCEFNNRRLLDKWVELRTQTANCMVAGEQLIFIGCADGIVRCFSPVTLQFVTTLPRTHYLGVDLARGLAISHMAAHPPGSRYPDCVGVTYDDVAHKVTCFYNDHSVYVWDVRDIRKVGKSHSFLYHSACIWGVEMYPQLDGMKSVLPPGSFITCSSDDTVRVWNLEPNMAGNTVYKRNIYSNDLLKILYLDPQLQYIKDVDQGPRGDVTEKSEPGYDCKNGVRCIKISPDGKHLASGDRQGNIRVHELQFMDEQCKIEAHDAEVLCLEFSRPDTGWRLLASASRDRLIHLFRADQQYQFLQTLDDHSSSITAVKFFQNQDRTYMVSCGADKSVIFRKATPTPDGSSMQFTLSHNVVGKTTLYDMEVDRSQRHILTACQDRNIRVYNVTNGRHSKTFKGSIGDDGTLIKLSMDQSGLYVCTSCTDRTLCIYDYYSGECMASMFGHSELVTGLRFTNDCRRLVSVSGDGCVFVWAVPHDMTQTMVARLQQQASRSRRRQTQSAPVTDTEPLSPEEDSRAMDTGSPADYRFSLGHLPQWAKKKVKERSPAASQERPIDFPPKGRWAQRIDAGGITVKSIYDTDSVIPFPGDTRRAGSVPDSEGSKDSSLEEPATAVEGRDAASRRPHTSRTLRRPDLIDPRSRNLTDDSSDMGSYRLDDATTDHDGDIDEYSEPESAENDAAENLMYYPQPSADDTASQFTVNAMDQEELRRSVRRYRRARPARLQLATTASDTAGTPTQESDDEEEEEEVSTPSADTDGRIITSALSASMESLDMEKSGLRNQFLTKNFESLSRGDGLDRSTSESPNGKTSISSQFLGKSYQANIARSQESLKKREELQRRIQETRRKLQDIGYRSNLRTSQSISDLPAALSAGSASAESPSHGGGLRGGSFANNLDSGGSGGLRRAVSLSDLTEANMPRRVLPHTPVVSGKKAPPIPKKPVRPNSAMARSSSANPLNPTDGDPSRPMRGPMKPTISSLNKQKSPTAAVYRPLRLSGAVSVGDIRVADADSSSEDMLSPTETLGQGTFKARPLANDRNNASRLKGGGLLGRTGGGSERDLSKIPRDSVTRLGGGVTVTKTRQQTVTKQSTVTMRGYADVRESSPETDWDVLDVDVNSLPLTQEVCETMVAVLQRSAQNVLQLHRRLQLRQQDPAAGAADELTQLLGAGAQQSVALLRSVAAGPEKSALLPEATNPAVLQMMHQYSEALISMMQQRIHRPNS